MTTKMIHEFTAKTDGSGLWSKAKKAVKIRGFHLVQYDGCEFGELRIFFETKSWKINKHGLIYTDEQFIKEISNEFEKMGLSSKAAKDISYSEQGMQEVNYVSMDAGKYFIGDAKRQELFNMEVK